MQYPSPPTVLGDFESARFDAKGHRALFFKQAGKYLVETEDADGHSKDFEVAYTFGVDPLQQYLLRLPGGRLQAFDIAWDSKPRAAGGQRWFALQPATPPPGDRLHWTGREHGWNYACASCHSTNVRKGYDFATNTYKTLFDAVDVACAACHGQADAHLAWAVGHQPPGANHGFSISVREADTPRFAAPTPDHPIAARLAAGTGAAPELCFGCHARREALIERPQPGTPFLDAYRPALLETGLYETDGRNKGEVFEYGAFMQSAMARAGVSCLNCHEPHSGGLKAQGNALCAQCHFPARFDTSGHTHRSVGAQGSACIDCHMPQRTYMGVHLRHDHGFRLPVPPSFASAFAAGRAGAPADARLRMVLAANPSGDKPAAGIVRATAASLLANGRDAADVAALQAAARDADPLVRMGVARAAAKLNLMAQAALAPPLFADAQRAVRVEAVSSMAGLPDSFLSASAIAARHRAEQEFQSAEAVNAERPEAHAALSDYRLSRGDPAGAAVELSKALRLAPDFWPALVDAADLRRAAGDEPGTIDLLRKAMRVAPTEPLPLVSLAMSRLRQADLSGAVDLLTKAVSMAPVDPMTIRLLVTGLGEQGRIADAREVLDRALAGAPDDSALLRLSATAFSDARSAVDALHLQALIDTDFRSLSRKDIYGGRPLPSP